MKFAFPVRAVLLLSATACSGQSAQRYEGPLAAFADSVLPGNVARCEPLPTSFRPRSDATWQCKGDYRGSSTVVLGGMNERVLLVSRMWQARTADGADSVFALAGDLLRAPGVQFERCSDDSRAHRWQSTGSTVRRAVVVDSSARTVLEIRALDSLTQAQACLR